MSIYIVNIICYSMIKIHFGDCAEYLGRSVITNLARFQPYRSYLFPRKSLVKKERIINKGQHIDIHNKHFDRVSQ